MRVSFDLRGACQVAILLAAAACGEAAAPSPGMPTITITPDSVHFSSLGEGKLLMASASDEAGNVVAAPLVTWSVADPSVAAVDITGGVVAVGNGATTVTASYESVSAVAKVAVQQAIATLQRAGGHNQIGFANQTLPAPIVVLVTDARGNGIPGVSVQFREISGGGSLVPSLRVTGADGQAAVEWTLGPTTGQQRVRAQTLTYMLDFTATAQ